ASHGLLRALERGATSVQVELLSGSVPPPRDTVDEPQPLLVTHLVIHRPTLPRDTPPGTDRQSTRALWCRPAGCRRRWAGDGRLCAEAGGWLGAEGSAARRRAAYGRRSRRKRRVAPRRNRCPGAHRLK